MSENCALDDVKNEKRWCVYMHTNLVNRKKYIGITSLKPERRWLNGLGYQKNKHFWRAIQKYGWNNFKHEVIFQNETFEYACKIEKCLIKHYKTKNPKYGYNKADGGQSGMAGYCHSETTKQKMRQNHADVSGVNNPHYGKSLSEETKRKISEANKGKQSPMRGKHHSDETKQRWSEIRKGRTYSQDTKRKMSESRTGPKNGRAKPVYCPELNEIFWGAKQAFEKYGINQSDITCCCKKRMKNGKNIFHAGKHPITHKPLSWRYADELDAVYSLICILNKIIIERNDVVC